MKLNFEIDDYSTTPETFREYLEETRKQKMDYSTPGGERMIDVVDYCLAALDKYSFDAIRRFEMYATVRIALSSVLSRPQTREELEAQKAASFIVSGAFYLFAETVERAIGRRLDSDENVCVASILEGLTTVLYFVGKEGKDE